jgi:hypothetical protein
VNFAISMALVETLLVTIVVCVPVFGESKRFPAGAVNGTVCVTLVLSKKNTVPDEIPLTPAEPVGPVAPVGPVGPVGPVTATSDIAEDEFL